MATRTARNTKWRAAKKPAKKKAAKKKSAGGARAIWKGVIRLGASSIPVKLYSAAQDKSIRFRLLDPKKHEPVKQQMIDPRGAGAKDDEIIEHEEVQRAWQSKAGLLIMLSDEELESTEPKPSRDIDVSRFVDPEKVPAAYYERPYWVGPDEKGGSAYFALARALGDAKKLGVVRWVMRGKEYVGALTAKDGYLVLVTMRNKGEVVLASQLPTPAGRELSRKEMDMAKALVESMRGDFDIAQFKDTYRERVLELVEAKAKGKVLRFPKAPVRREAKDLASVLEKSLAAAKKRKSA